MTTRDGEFTARDRKGWLSDLKIHAIQPPVFCDVFLLLHANGIEGNALGKSGHGVFFEISSEIIQRHLTRGRT